MVKPFGRQRTRPLGRQKIRMEKMKNRIHRQVTFSKRKTGLFKKAAEVSTLCNEDIAIVVVSPAGKPYAYGSPTAENVIARYLGDPNPDMRPDDNEISVHELNRQITRAYGKFEELERRNEDLEELKKYHKSVDITDANDRLEELNACLGHLKNIVTHEAKRRTSGGASTSGTSSNSDNGVIA